MFGGFFWLIALLVVLVVGAAGLWSRRAVGERRRARIADIEQRDAVGR